MSSELPKVPVFLCYRRVDGDEYARWLNELLDSAEIVSESGETARLEVFYDQNQPASENWREWHFPHLKRAKALILLLTPGVKAELSDEGEPDWVYEELRWWISNRRSAPIIIDPIDDSRYIPTVLQRKWPTPNRLRLDREYRSDALPKERDDFKQRLIESIRILGQRIVHDELQQKRRLLRTLYVALFMAIAASLIAYDRLVEASEQRDRSTALLLVAESKQLKDTNLAASLLLANAAVDTQDNFESRGNLLNAAQNIPPRLKALMWGHDGRLNTVARGSESSLVLTGGVDGKTILWNSDEKTVVCDFVDSEHGSVLAVAVSPSGRYLASGFSNGTLIVRKLSNALDCEASGYVRQAHTGQLRALAFSGDAELLASGGLDSNVVLWHPETGEQVGAPLRMHNTAIMGLAFSRDGRRLISGAFDGAVLWEVADGAGSWLLAHQAGLPPKRQAHSVALSADGRIGAAGQIDGNVMLWDFSLKQRVPTFLTKPGAKPRGGAPITAIVFDARGENIYVGSRTGVVDTWNVPAAKRIAEPLRTNSPIRGLAVSSDGKWLASGTDYGALAVWDLTASAAGPVGGGASASAIRVSPDARLLALANETGTASLQDAQTGLLKFPLALDEGTWVTSFAFRADGRWLAAGLSDGQVLRWNTETQARVSAPLAHHHSEVLSIGWSSDGDQIASSSRDGKTILWHLASTQEVSTVLSESGAAGLVLAFAEAEDLLAIGRDDGAVELWNTSSMQNRALPRLTTAPVLSLAFGPAGRNLAVGRIDKTVTLFNATTGELLGGPHKGHDAGVWSLAYHAKDSLFASADEESTVIFWDAKTLRRFGEPVRFNVIPTPVLSLAFNEASQELVLVSGWHSHAEYRRVSVSVAGLQSRICDFVAGEPNVEEWRKYSLWDGAESICSD